MIWYDVIVAILCFGSLVYFLYNFIKKEKTSDGIWTLIALNMLIYLLLK